MARKKKIPSVDEALQIRFDQLEHDQDLKLERLQEQVGTLSRKLAGLDRKVTKLRTDSELQQVRLGDSSRPRKRVSPEKAQSAILNRLKKARGRYVTSRELGRPLAIGRATVAARVKELRAEGYDIDSSPRKGYALSP
jgi:biotin operon repressor